MAVSAADLNQIRVNVLGTTVDAAGATWTTAPPAAANALLTAQRIINRAINQLANDGVGTLNSVAGFNARFSEVVGDEAGTDQAAFQSLGSNLIQAVAALIAGGGIVPGALEFEFEFPDPLDDGDFVEVPVTVDCTIDADLAGAEYNGAPQADDMFFELTVEPAGDVVGEVHVAAGNIVSLSGIGGEITAGSTLRLTADNIVGGPVSPAAVITIPAKRAIAPPTAGRFEFTQAVADTTWTIPHNLGQRIVAVQIVDDGGTPVLADVDFETANRCVVTFARPKAGTAVIRR